MAVWEKEIRTYGRTESHIAPGRLEARSIKLERKPHVASMLLCMEFPRCKRLFYSNRDTGQKMPTLKHKLRVKVNTFIITTKVKAMIMK